MCSILKSTSCVQCKNVLHNKSDIISSGRNMDAHTDNKHRDDVKDVETPRIYPQPHTRVAWPYFGYHTQTSSFTNSFAPIVN